MATNFMMLSRDLFESEDYLLERFTRREALLDLLYLAAYKDRTFKIRGIVVEQKAGQVAKSIRELAGRWHWSVNTVQRYLKELESDGVIDTQKSSVIQVITIKKYLVLNTQRDTRTDTQFDTQIDTPNYIDNKDIKIEKDTIVSKKKVGFVRPSVDEVAAYISEKGYHFDAERFHAYYESNGWMVGRNKMKDWKAACRTWESKRREDSPSLFETKSQQKDPTIPNTDKYEPDLPYDNTMCAYIVPNKYPDLNEDWPYTPENRPDGARICNGSNGWRWDSSNKLWIEMLWIMDKKQWIDR